MAAARKKGDALRVVAPLVQVVIGSRAVQFYNGDILPEGVGDDSIKHLKSLGYVEETEASTEPDEK